MQNKSKMLEALRLVWIVCLAVEAFPTDQSYGLADVRKGDEANSQQNFPEPMMEFFRCDRNQSCLEAYGWPTEYPHSEYTVRAVIGNVSRNGSSLLLSFLLSVTDPGRSAMQLKLFKSALPNDTVSILPDSVHEDGANYTLSVETEKTGVYKRIDDITIPKEELLKSGWITFSSANISALFSEWILQAREKITFRIQVLPEEPKLINALNCVRNRKDPLALEFVKIKEKSRLTLLDKLQMLDFNLTGLDRIKRQEPSKCETSQPEEDAHAGCHLKDFLIPFSVYGLTDIIPDAYNARYCSGGCDFPIPASQASFHAHVHSYVAAMKGSNSSVVTCVPTNYTSAQALQKGEHGVYEIVLFGNLSASECGCR